MGQQMIGDGTDGQGATIVAGRQIVQLSRFHLDGENAVAGHLLAEIWAFIIKHIRRINAAHMGSDALFAHGGHSRFQQAIIGTRRKVDLFEHAKRRGGEGRGGHGNHHIAQLDLRAHTTCRANADQCFGIIVFDQLIDVDG